MQLGVLDPRAIREKHKESAMNRIHSGFVVFMPGRNAITAKWAKILPVIGPLLGTFWGLFTRDLTVNRVAQLTIYICFAMRDM